MLFTRYVLIDLWIDALQHVVGLQWQPAEGEQSHNDEKHLDHLQQTQR